MQEPKYEFRSLHGCEYSSDNDILQVGKVYEYQVAYDPNEQFECRYVDAETGVVAYQFMRSEMHGVLKDLTLYNISDKFEIRICGGPRFKEIMKYEKQAKA